MRLLAILGSPRAGGNTDILSQRVIDGAIEAGHEAEVFALRDMNIRPCIGCEGCWKRERPCVFNDDMDKLYDAIARADVLLIATPVYWYAPTAIMKAFFDRLVPLNRPEGKSMINGKAAILVTAYEEEGFTAAEPLVRMFDLSCDYMGLRIIDRIVVDKCGPKAAVLDQPEALAQARQVGLDL